MPTPTVQVLDWNALTPAAQETALLRPVQKSAQALQDAVETIKNRLQKEGDAALFHYAKIFDKTELDSLAVDADAVNAACTRLDAELKTAIDRAYDNIHAFHSAQKSASLTLEVMEGVVCQSVTRPIERVGLYIPGGSAPLFSTVLMLGIPASIAGASSICLCTPAPVHDAVLYAARKCGITQIFSVGGAGAVFAMAYGTQSIPKVDKIFGPGNAYVTEAKRRVLSEGVAIDMPAGPSEVLVIADENANASFIAADLLSQAEHGEDSQVILLTPCAPLIEQVQTALAAQIATLSRKKMAAVALSQSRLIQVRDLAQALEVSNQYAPEHLIVQTQDPHALLDDILHAGSVFLGAYSPESMGDYASGTNHVLPTYGYARTASSLGLADFCKRMTVQHLTPQGFLSLAPTVATMAQAEALDAHKLAVTVRVDALKEAGK